MKDQNTFFFFDYQLPPLFFYPYHLALRQRYNTIITNSTLCFIFIISLDTTSFSIINILFTYSLSPHSYSHSSLSDHHHRHNNYLQIHNVSNIYRFYRYICRLHFWNLQTTTTLQSKRPRLYYAIWTICTMIFHLLLLYFSNASYYVLCAYFDIWVKVSILGFIFPFRV